MNDNKSEIDYLSPDKQKLFGKLLAEEGAEFNSFPLSYAQQRLWFLDQLVPQSPIYNLPAAVRLSGPLNVPALQLSINQIIARHESLRTRFATLQGQPVQLIEPRLKVNLSTVDLTHIEQARQQDAVWELGGQVADLPFDLGRLPLLRAVLIRLAEQDHALILMMHHIVSDGWSLGVLIREMRALYEANVRGEEPALPELEIQYADYAVWQREYLIGEVLDRQMRYWREQLAGMKPLEVPVDRARPKRQSYRGSSERVEVSRELSERVKQVAREEGVTVFMVLLACYKVLLARYTGEREIVVGTDIANRTRVETEGLIGFFVNQLVMRSEVGSEMMVREVVRRVGEVAVSGYMNQDVPFERLVEEMRPGRESGLTPLFQTKFVFQEGALEDDEVVAGLRVSRMGLKTAVTPFDLFLSMFERNGSLVGTMNYSTELYDRSTIKRMLGHYVNILEAAVADLDQQVSRLPLMGSAEREQLLVEWNDTAINYPQNYCLHHLFEKQVERTPNKVAVVFEQQRLSYRQLNESANQLARYLQDLGVGPESLVGICAEQSLEMVIGLLGILKAGGAYVPLDPAYPKERLGLMMEDSRVGVVLTQRKLSDVLPPYGAKVLLLDAEWDRVAVKSGDNPESRTRPDNAAYVMYTSGSTGKPKGVVTSHRGICNRLLWMQDEYGLNESDVVLQKTSFAFDVSVWEFFWPLIIGARLLLVRPGGQRDSKYMVKLIIDQAVTTMHAVPTMVRAFLDEAGIENCKSIKRIICSGEALTYDLKEKFFKRLDAELHNLYGPTEASIDVTYWQCNRDSNSKVVPIGKPIANTQIYILDRNLEPLPVGVPGELHIGGVGLARGYLNRPDLTGEKFVPDPFSREPGRRIYKTGDLARFMEDGNVEFLGRIDHQVKIRGNRIELGEIESALGQYPAVQEAAVIVREDVATDKRLVAYVVASEGSEPTRSALREFLKQKMPDYMVPAAFVFLPSLPMTTSGKLDRKALPAPDLMQSGLYKPYTAPRTLAEDMLASIWAQVLNVESVGIHDNFFELGGHSLLATQVMSRIGKTFQIEIPLTHIFQNPTVASLAESIEQATRQETQQAPTMKRASREKPLPLSYAQQRLWFLDQLVPQSPIYNLPAAVRLSGPLNVPALQLSINQIIARHESLRTRFATLQGQPVQLIEPRLKVILSTVDLTHIEQARQQDAVWELGGQVADLPFDLGRLPLLRAVLIKLAEQDHALILMMHHIVSDGWSLGVLIREMRALYEVNVRGEEAALPELEIQYADYAVWQREYLIGEVLDRQMRYWREQLAGMKPTEAPVDRARPKRQSYRGSSERVEVSRELSERVKQVAREEGVTVFMVLLACYKVLLARYTGEREIVVGTDIANRTRVETEGLIGFFVNQLVMRSEVGSEMSVREVVRRVGEVAVSGYMNQDVPFERLVEEMRPGRESGLTPLFQTKFIFQTMPSDEMVGGLRLGGIDIKPTTSPFDLLLSILERDGELIATMVYSTELYDRSTIKRMLGHYLNLLQQTVDDINQPVSMLRLLTDEETGSLGPMDFPDADMGQRDFENLILELGLGVEGGTT